jgi:hypothetical protein
VCETLFLTFNEDHRFEGSSVRNREEYLDTRDGMRGGRRNLHKDELHNNHSSPNVITEIIQSSMRWAGRVACIGGKRSADNNSVGVPVKNRKI